MALTLSGLVTGAPARLAVLCAVLAGCSGTLGDKSEKQATGLSTITSAFKQALRTERSAGTTKPISQYTRDEIIAASGGASILRATIPAMTIDGLMVPRDDKGAVVTWTDGVQVTFTFRNGVLIETRGLGPDLMSAAAPTPGQIAGSASYARSYFFVGPEDTTERRDYTCTPENRGAATIVIYGRSHSVRHVAEVCERAEGRITNEFWLEGGTIRRSRQWASPRAGYMTFERVTD